jgi:hypothetical protein
MVDRPGEVAPAQAVDRRNRLGPRGRHTAGASGRVIAQPNCEDDNEEHQDEQRDNGRESPVALGDLT